MPGDAVSDLGSEAQVGPRHLLHIVLVEALALGHSEVVLPVPRGAWGRARWCSVGTEGTRWDRTLGTLTFAHEGGDAHIHEVYGHHGVVGGGVVLHGFEGGVSGDGVKCYLRQLLPQELGYLGDLLAGVLWDRG